MNRIIFVLALPLCIAGAKAQTQIPAIVTDTTSTKDSASDDNEELETVVISTTRSTRTIANLPTRVELIGGEEIDEKNNMRSANVSMLLHESTGVQVQQTSATSANASIRIQGLDGRYTQLLKDGYPNFGNFSGGLSILEIPPLDLKQVEIIKGPASTLYGAGAIAGVVNFISRTPGVKPCYSAIINQSHVGQTNVGGFVAQRWKKVGFTILVLANRQLAYDVDKDGFTELPKSTDFTLHPKLFFYPNSATTVSIGNSFTTGERTGGDVDVIENGPGSDHTYFEKNTSVRDITTFELVHRLNGGDNLTLKSSFSYFNRRIEIPSYLFDGTSKNFFTELSYLRREDKHTITAGANFILDDFREQRHTPVPLRDLTTTTIGAFLQDTWDVNKWFSLESGVRLDVVNYENELYRKIEVLTLPRVSGLFIWTSKLSSRVGGGLGYKTPTLFTEQTESFQYQNLAPLYGVVSERSIGGTADINYRTQLNNELRLSLNHMFFLTRISKPTVLEGTANRFFYFFNNSMPVNSKGFETNLKLIYKHNYKLFVGYTFTSAKAHYLTGNQTLPLLPRNKINLALVYEREGWLKAGLEAYFTDRQYLSNGTRTPSFWELGAMAEKTFGIISLFLNAENFTDTRQSNYKSVVNGPHISPSFDEIWTHTEGFVLNGGIKLKL